MALWRDDIIRMNGFEEKIAGWGFEDTDLVLRWFNLGGRLKNGRFATTVLHLWHREAARDAAEENERRARLAGSRGATVAEQGLAQLADTVWAASLRKSANLRASGPMSPMP